MAIARVDNNQIIEQRSISLDDVPAHKRAAWRPIEGDAPDYRPELEVATGPVFVIESTRVVRKWAIERRPLEEQRRAVKDEARRRILIHFPEWKQVNLTARGVELQDIWRENGAWTVQEANEAAAIRGVWAWVKAVRDASNVIEAMNPIPRDYDADAYWPA